MIDTTAARYEQGPDIRLSNKTKSIQEAKNICVAKCEIDNPGNTEGIAKCMIQCATIQGAILILGCVRQRTIGDWATAGLCIGCIKELVATSNPAQNYTSTQASQMSI